MAFGKIAIQTEDGDLEEYELTKPTTSVGRQPGNDIVLNTTAVSRYHAQLDVAEGGVYLVDLGTVNGTFVNDAQIDANGRVLLNHGDVITLGDVALRFIAPEVRSGSKRAAVSLTPEARTIEAPGVPFRLVLDEPQQSVAPGARLQLTLVIENLTQQPLGVTIEIGGLEAEWIKVNRRDASLEPQEQVQAMISVRPPRSSHTRPGVYALTIRVAAADDPTKVLEAVREIDVVAYAGLGIVIQRSRSGEQYHLAVQNQGNQPTQIVLEGYQRQRQLKFRFQPREISLQPGETQQASLTISPASGRPFGSPQELTFAVVARSLDDAAYQAPVVGRYTVTPSWPKFLLGAALPMLFGGLVVLALLAAGLVALGMLTLPGMSQELTTTPLATAQTLAPAAAGTANTVAPAYAASIEYFRASPDEVTYRTTGVIALEWSATGYDRIELHLGDEGGPLIELRPEDISARQRRILIEELPFGRNDFTLVVTGQDEQAVTRQASVLVTAFTCPLVPGTAILTRPAVNAPPAPTPEPNSEGVVIIGRSRDNSWAYVTYDYDDPLLLTGQRGWVLVGALQCPAGMPDIRQYVPVNDAELTLTPPASTPSPVASPTAGQQQPGPPP